MLFLNREMVLLMFHNLDVMFDLNIVLILMGSLK